MYNIQYMQQKKSQYRNEKNQRIILLNETLIGDDDTINLDSST